MNSPDLLVKVIEAADRLNANAREFLENHAASLACLKNGDRDGTDAYNEAKQDDLRQLVKSRRAYDAAREKVKL